MNRKALLIFADPVGLDLAKRCLPRSLRPLFGGEALRRAHGLEVDVHIFTSARHSCAPNSRIHPQIGSSFAERLENAVETIAAHGYQELVLVGRDCPQLDSNDIVSAFAQLQHNQLVLGPDHRGGCYLIALHASDRPLLRGIGWRRNTDLEQLRQRCGPTKVSLLAVKQDVDSWCDLQILAKSASRFAALAVSLLQAAYSLGGKRHEFFVSIALCADRARRQMPPPALA